VDKNQIRKIPLELIKGDFRGHEFSSATWVFTELQQILWLTLVPTKV
jgi:hypothetical protein